ncbi:MAG TPA: TonB-dependent receptor, partial [Anaerolineales bacterium]
LDQDLAARSASLARIYGDLGFPNLALVEGWKSVNTDPANYSAHRFLADSYGALPRHEIARVSELLQSQLLQPINITPVKPRLAESNLFAVSGGGPSGLGFNEFNPLFERNRFALQADGVVGENDTAGDEIVLAGLSGRYSASVGQYHYETDGFRANNGIDDDIYNAFLQVSLSPAASVQAEYRYRNRKNGDLKMTFFPDDFSPNLSEEERTDTFRLGFHYAFSPGSHLLASGVYQKGSLDSLDRPVDPFLLRIDSKSDRKGYSGELQHQYSFDRFKTVAGAGYFKVTGDDALTVDSLLDPGPPPLTDTFSQTVPQDSRHVNVYLYTYVGCMKNVTLTIGASGDFFRKDIQDLNLNTVEYTKNQLNPKLGVVWNPVPDTTIRGAVFRTLRRTLTTNATLEPTQVAGFNQFYDEAGIAAVAAWNYGLALDQKFPKNVYGGVEGYYRDLEVPFPTIDLNTNTLISTVEDWKEKVGRAYLYWTPHNWVALSAEYLYERFERGETGNLQAKEVTTQRLPLGINFFHPSGLNAMVKGSYWDQTGSITRKIDFPPVYQSVGDTFWLVDAAIGYRLPQRYGFLTVGAKNLFNRSFNYYDTDPVNPAIQPVRTFYAKIN